jgi:hypothetical protein
LQTGREGGTALEGEINRLKQEVEGAAGEREAEGDGRTDVETEGSDFKLVDNNEELVAFDPAEIKGRWCEVDCETRLLSRRVVSGPPSKGADPSSLGSWDLFGRGSPPSDTAK